MKYLFFVQGEGRGHLTQALTLKEKLTSRGHTIVAVIVGTSNNKKPPTFFQEQINAPLFFVDNFNFVVDKNNQGIKIFASVMSSIPRLLLYYHSIKKIRSIVADLNPDVLINFYEHLVGSYCRLYRDKRPLICIAHQYFIEHPAFKFPTTQKLARVYFKLFNRLTAPHRAFKIALSFTAENDQPKKKLFICPPLIRKVIKQQNPTTSDFLLIYILNAGYSEKIITWSNSHPGIKIEAFWNHPEQTDTKINNDLTFHHLSGIKFINLLVSCRAYASTGGFDSISEAAYLQKPILMNPTKNHFEQKCNAADARRCGLALTADNFDLSLITTKQKTHSPEALRRFKEWVDNNDNKIIDLLERDF